MAVISDDEEEDVGDEDEDGEEEHNEWSVSVPQLAAYPRLTQEYWGCEVHLSFTGAHSNRLDKNMPYIYNKVDF